MNQLGWRRWPSEAGEDAELSAFLELVTHSSSGFAKSVLCSSARTLGSTTLDSCVSLDGNDVQLKALCIPRVAPVGGCVCHCKLRHLGYSTAECGL